MTKKSKSCKTPKTHEAKVKSIIKLVDSITSESDNFQIKVIIKSIHSYCGSSFMTKVWADALITQKYLELAFAEMYEISSAVHDDEFLLAGDITENDIIS